MTRTLALIAASAGVSLLGLLILGGILTAVQGRIPDLGGYRVTIVLMAAIGVGALSGIGLLQLWKEI